MFHAGAVVGQAILDSSKWTAGERAVNASMGRMNKGLNVMKTAFVAAGTAVAGAIAVSIANADKWQKSFSNVSTLVDTAAVNTQEMALELLNLDERLGSATELTDGLYQALSASVEPAKAVEFVGEAAKFAKAALTETNTAVDVITTGLNAYGLEADKATDFSDKLFSVIRLGKTTGDELAGTIGSSIPLAANLGIQFDELGASVAIMTRQGISAAESTTQFNAVVNSFLKPSEELAQRFQEIGFSSGEAAIEELGFKGALDKVIESTGGSKEQLAGMFNNTRALRGVLALTGEGAKDFSSILDEITNSAGATQTAFEKQELTMDTFKNTADKLSIIVGNIGKTFSDELAVGATKATKSMITFLMSSQGAQLVSEIIAQVTAGFETLSLVIGPLVEDILSEMAGIWDTITTALDKVTGSAADGAGGFKIFAVAGATASSAIKIVSQVIQGTITNIGNLITAIQESGGVIGSFFDFLGGKKSWEEVEAQAGRAGKAFETFGTGFVTGFTNLFDTVFDEVSTFEDRVNESAGNIEIKWKTTYENTKSNVKSSYKELITGQQGFVDAVLQGADKIEHKYTNVFNNVSRQIESLHKKAEARLNAINKKMEEVIDKYKEWGVTIAGYVQPVFETFGEAIAKQELTWESLWDVVKDAIGNVLIALGTEAAAQAGMAFARGDFIAFPLWTAASITAFTGAGFIKALRQGGSLEANEPAIVGEAGMELFVPNVPGRVYSHNETKTMLGNTYNLTINTDKNRTGLESTNLMMLHRIRSYT